MESLKTTIVTELSRFINYFTETYKYPNKIHPICNHNAKPYDIRHSLKIQPTNCTCSHFYFYEACGHV
jgi:hypothetical protein